MRHPIVGGILPRRAIMIGLLGLLGLAFAGSVSAEAGRTVYMTGTERFVPNAMVQATLRFTPGPLTVASGDTVTWSDQTGAPHTITVIDAADVPDGFEDIFMCGPCGPALAGHFTDPPTFVLGGGADGTAGLDGSGDSLLVAPFGSVSAQVTAAAGTRLDYICAIHPWMIGSIEVR